MKVKYTGDSQPSLTINKIYKVISVDENYYGIISDLGHVTYYNKFHFEPVEEESSEIETEDLVKAERYNKGNIECIEVILDQNMDFLEGNTLKYLWRYKEKGGVSDLKKAQYYLNKLIEREEEK